MVPIVFNQANCLYQGLLEILRQKSLNMEVTQMFSFQNQKSHTLQSIHLNMILSWWAQMEFLTKWRMKISHNSFGIWETNQFNHQNRMIQKVKNYLLLEKQHQKLSQNRWKICHSIILRLCLLFLIARKNS